MIRPKFWKTTGSWVEITAERPNDVTDAPVLRFRKSAVCTFTSGQLIHRYPKDLDLVREAGNYKATFLCVDGQRWEFEFESRQYFLQFCDDMDEAFRT